MSFLVRVFVSSAVRKVAYIAVAAVFAFLGAQCAHAAQCVTLEVDGTLTPVAVGVEACAGFVLATPTEFQASQSIFVALSLENGAAIGAAIFLAWAVAFGFRVLRKVIEDADFLEGA
jgi:hypothetical protein